MTVGSASRETYLADGTPVYAFWRPVHGGVETPGLTHGLKIINPVLFSARRGDPAPLEGQEAKWLVEWYQRAARDRVIAHVMNEHVSGKRSHGAIKKAEGVLAGYPDYLVEEARGGWHGLRIELKRVRGSKMSDEQKLTQAHLLSKGYLSVVAPGWRVAAAWIGWYIKQPVTHDCSPMNRVLPERLDCLSMIGVGTVSVFALSTYAIELAPILMGERG